MDRELLTMLCIRWPEVADTTHRRYRASAHAHA